MGNQPSANSHSGGSSQHQQQQEGAPQQHSFRSASTAAAATSAASGFSSTGSGGGGVAAPFRTLFRNANALGLTRAELDERCNPSGLYPTCQWEDKVIRRLIGDGKIASRLKGKENRTTATDQECPICFLNYRDINVTTCCQANLCTECYLQIRPQKEKAALCPFCNKTKFNVKVARPMDEQAIRERELEEQHIIEATIRARGIASNNNSVESSADEKGEDPDKSAQASANTNTSPSSAMAFGSSLEQNERIKLLRVRSSSMSPSDNSSDPGGAVDITALAMTAEERRALEEEMRAQHLHPLALRLQAEETERRMASDREYYQRQLERLRELRSRRQELLRHMQENPYDSSFSGLHYGQHQLVSSGLASSGRRRAQGSENAGITSRQALPQSNLQSLRSSDPSRQGLESTSGSPPSSTIQSLDDLIVLETALMLSQQDGGASERLPSVPISNLSLPRSTDIASGGPSDASRPAFPLSLVGRRGNSTSAATSRYAGRHSNREYDDYDEEEDDEEFSLFSNSYQRRLIRGAQQRAAALRDMFVPGMSEEDQIALAIAASLEEQFRNNAASPDSTTTTAVTTNTPDQANRSSADVENGGANEPQPGEAILGATRESTDEPLATDSATTEQVSNPAELNQGNLLNSACVSDHPTNIGLHLTTESTSASVVVTSTATGEPILEDCTGLSHPELSHAAKSSCQAATNHMAHLSIQSQTLPPVDEDSIL